ncbi:hypothetical protein GQ53DRAFT_606251, partial [Thozetella sp. PMI_491]
LLLASSGVAIGAEVHGQGAEGTTMGPVAFLWPSDRPWSASADNVAPCGSTGGVTNRTIFPLSQGSVALSIADDAWNVAFSIAYENDPQTQSAFTQQVVSNVSAIEPGHQCYKIGQIPSTVAQGTNATIQLEYWSNVDNELGGRNQSFYACADITFVEAVNFSIQVPCFNVTSSDFELPAQSSSSAVPTATGSSNGASETSTAAASSSSGDGLSTGAKAGIAVGVIVASLSLVGAIAFFLLRKRKAQPSDREAAAPHIKMPETASVNS